MYFVKTCLDIPLNAIASQAQSDGSFLVFEKDDPIPIGDSFSFLVDDGSLKANDSSFDEKLLTAINIAKDLGIKDK